MNIVFAVAVVSSLALAGCSAVQNLIPKKGCETYATIGGGVLGTLLGAFYVSPTTAFSPTGGMVGGAAGAAGGDLAGKVFCGSKSPKTSVRE